jgi:hypothetical protein
MICGEYLFENISSWIPPPTQKKAGVVHNHVTGIIQSTYGDLDIVLSCKEGDSISVNGDVILGKVLESLLDC